MWSSFSCQGLLWWGVWEEFFFLNKYNPGSVCYSIQSTARNSLQAHLSLSSSKTYVACKTWQTNFRFNKYWMTIFLVNLYIVWVCGSAPEWQILGDSIWQLESWDTCSAYSHAYVRVLWQCHKSQILGDQMYNLQVTKL